MLLAEENQVIHFHKHSHDLGLHFWVPVLEP